MTDLSGPQPENAPRQSAEGGARPVNPLTALQSGAGNAAMAALISSTVRQQVGALPDLDDRSLPAPERVQQAVEQAGGAGAEVEALSSAPAAVRSFVEAQVPERSNIVREVEELRGGEDGPEAAVPEVASAPSAPAAGPQGEPAPQGGGQAQAGAPPQKSRWERFKEGASSVGSAIGGFFSSIGSAIASPFRNKQARTDTARTANTTLSVGTGLTNAASQAPGIVGNTVMDNSLTEGAARLGGSSATQGLHNASTTVADAGGATIQVVHTVAGAVGLFFSFLKGALDTRSLISSIRVHRSLKKARKAAEGRGYSKEVIDAVDYAISQKYTKILRRAAGAALAFATLGVGLAVLISNPVGAGIVAIILAGIGLVWGLYKIYHAIKKRFGVPEGQRAGVKRGQMAKLLYSKAKDGDQLAITALTSLGLTAAQVTAGTEEDGVFLISRKLKST